MLLCNNCNGGYHLFCLKLKLTQVPTDNWYCSSCSPIAPWFLLRPCHTFPGSSLGGDTWEFHLSFLLCILYICACISFWLISLYLWLALIFLFSRIYYGFTPLRHRTSQHYTSRHWVILWSSFHLFWLCFYVTFVSYYIIAHCYCVCIVFVIISLRWFGEVLLSLFCCELWSASNMFFYIISLRIKTLLMVLACGLLSLARVLCCFVGCDVSLHNISSNFVLKCCGSTISLWL
jgi:hypothetical protein